MTDLVKDTETAETAETVDNVKSDELEGGKDEGKASEGTQDTFSPYRDENKSEESVKTEVGDDIDDEDKKAISSVVDDRTAGLQDDLEGLKAANRVGSFLEDEKNEVYKPFAAKIKEYASDPRAKGMSVEAIARLAINPRELMDAGAKQEREASKEAKAGQSSGGSSARPEGKGGELPDAFGLSSKDFEKTVASIR